MIVENNVPYGYCNFQSVMSNSFSYVKKEENKSSIFIPKNSILITPNENNFISMNNRRDYQYYEKK